MLYSKILVAYNDTELSNKALEAAVEIAKANPTAEIDILYAVEVPLVPVYQSAADFQMEQEEMNEYAKDILKKAKDKVKDLSNPIQAYVVDGKPIQAILSHAEKHENDLIIIGNRGLKGVNEFLNSVSHVVIQKSEVPVLLVK